MEQKSSTSQKTKNQPDPNPAGSATQTKTGADPAGKSMKEEQGSSGSGVVSQAKQTVTEVASQAGDKVSSRLDAQKDKAVENLDGFVQAVRQTAEQLREKDQNNMIPQYLNSAVNQVERVSGYLRSTDVRQMMTQVEQFARRQPAIFLGGAFALGLLGARFLKSSSPFQASTQPLGSPRDSHQPPIANRSAQTGQPAGMDRGIREPSAMSVTSTASREGQ